MTQADLPAATAAVLIIGDEILSGRTRDTNLSTIARFLTSMGIDLLEARTVGDRQAQIVEAVNQLRANHDYVFTTGGIGPTHDDITADAIGVAMGARLASIQRPWPCWNNTMVQKTSMPHDGEWHVFLGAEG